MVKTYEQIQIELKNKTYAPIYFLMGEEPYYIDKISNFIQNDLLDESQVDFNLSVLYGKDTDIRTIIQAAKRYPIGSQYQVIVVKEAQQIKQWDDMTYYLTQPVPTTILCFCYKYGKPDGRKKWFQELNKKATVLESKKLYDNQLAPWIKQYLQEKKTTISTKATIMLTEFLGNNLSKISNELDKLLIIKQKEQTEITPELIEQNIGISKDYNVFELQSALIQKDVLKANRIIKYFGENTKSNPIQLIVGQLFNFFSNLMIYHYLSNKSPQTVANELGINAYFVKDYQQAAQVFNAWKTMHIISYIRETDTKSKGINNSSVSDEDLLKELVFKILH